MDDFVNPGPAIGVGSDALKGAASTQTDPGNAVAELAREIGHINAAFLLVFVSPDYDRTEIEHALARHWPDTPIIGCTTAGEITTTGYAQGAMSCIAFPARHFRMTSRCITPLKGYSVSAVIEGTRAMADTFGATTGWRQMGFLFADGVSNQEDTLVAAIENGLAPIPVIGGSAGDNLDFNRTFVLHQGRFQTNAAVLALIETDFEFTELCFDHFEPGQQKMVVTDADPAERIVLEINAAPAADEYARIVGVAPEDLTPFVFAANPVLVRAGGRYHVRAIQNVVGKDALRFQSAIDLGLVLTLGSPNDIVEALERELAKLRTNRKAPDLVLGFDCILRRLEIEQREIIPQISEILSRNKVIGFNTYGEQHHGMHVNQTFVGVAFYDPGADLA